MKDLCTLITFGLAGHGEDYASRKPGERMGHLSGYDNPSNWKPDRANTIYKGAMVIDKRFPLEANESLAYASPIVATHLAEPPHYPNGPGPYDLVTVAQAVEWWRDKGARIGQVNAHGEIIWQN